MSLSDLWRRRVEGLDMAHLVEAPPWSSHESLMLSGLRHRERFEEVLTASVDRSRDKSFGKSGLKFKV